jgi:mevalonate kinase
MSGGTIVASAPGKLFVLGEYAVLDGCPAVVAAVDRFATVRMERNGAPGRLRIEAPQLGSSLDAPAALLPPVDGPLRFALAVLHEMPTAKRATLLDGLRITIQSELAQMAQAKPGLGSSAAVTTAVTAGLFHLEHGYSAGERRRHEVFATAWRAHRIAQGGAGSGADVAASVWGGLIRFQPNGDSLPGVHSLPLPKGLDLLAVWSGESAPTTDLIRRYRALGNGHAQRKIQFVDLSCTFVRDFLGTIQKGVDGLAVIDRAGRALEAFAEQTQMPIVTPALDRILRIARRHGAAAKVSGAGGGDCAIALTSDSQAAGSIREEWQRAGFHPLALRIAAEGVTSGHS